MTSKKPFLSEKTVLHPRNKHRNRYDFEQLCSTCPELSEFVFVNKYQNQTINFSDAAAVKALNKALLKHFYDINDWDIPADYLCPPIPGRADYIHYIADLLAENNKGVIPTGSQVKVLDIGVGANCVYPIIGQKEYGWNFVGADINPEAIKSANKIIAANPHLKDEISCRLQNSPKDIFKGIIQAEEKFTVSICNPPFHASLAEVAAGSNRKWKNLGIKPASKTKLNFGGQNAELWCDGGELQFISNMISQSAEMPDACIWFTTLVSKQENLPLIYKALKNVNALQVKTIDMAQGQKISRIVAWTFFLSLV